MCNTIAHNPLMDDQTEPEQWPSLPYQIPHFYCSPWSAWVSCPGSAPPASSLAGTVKG